MLALPAPSAPVQGQKGGKGRKKEVVSDVLPAKGSGKGQVAKDFDYLMKLPLEFRANFHEKFHKNEICYNFQRIRLQAFRWDMQVLACMCGLRRFQALQRVQVPHLKIPPEPHLLQSLIQFRRFLLPCPFPRLFPV